MLKKLLSLFVLLTIVGSMRSQTYDFTGWYDFVYNATTNPDAIIYSNDSNLPNVAPGLNLTGNVNCYDDQGLILGETHVWFNVDKPKVVKITVTCKANSTANFQINNDLYAASAKNWSTGIGVLKVPAGRVEIFCRKLSEHGILKKIEIEDAIYFEKNGNMVESDEAEFIALNYDEPKLKGLQDGDEVTYSITDVEGGRIASFLNSSVNDIMFINCGVCDVHAKVKRYGEEIADVSYRLTIRADNATYEVNEYTYTLTGNGKLLENVVRGQVPKITMTFGNPNLENPNATMVRNNDGGSTPVGTILDQNGWRQVWMTTVQQNGVDKLLPYQGSFYSFTPETDGLLTVRGFFNNTSNTAYFVDARNLAPKPMNATAYLTSLVDKSWGGIGKAGTNVAPAVETADDDHPQMSEVYKWDRIFGHETPISQTVSGLPNGTYRVTVYANAMFTPNRGVKQIADYEARPYTAGEDDAYFTEGKNYAEIRCNDNDNYKVQVTAGSGGSVGTNGQYVIDGIVVSNGTLKIDYMTHEWNYGKCGVNWITIQIKSIEKTDGGSLTTFTPIREISATSSTEEVVTENIPLEKGQTYYLYGNIPSTNGVDGWLTYQLHSFTFIPGVSFAEWSHVLEEGHNSYFQAVQGDVSGVKYTIARRGDITAATIDESTGAVTNITGDGGAIIVTATKTYDDGSKESDFYVITKPYKTHKWTFANMNYTEVGKEDLVCSDLLVNGDLDWAVNYKVREYNSKTRNLIYINVPVMANNTALHGENAAYIGTTAGLLVNANSKCFGSNATMSFNLLDNLTADEKNDASKVDAALRSMLQCTKADIEHDASGHYTTDKITWKKGAKIIIPALKEGQYVRIKWKRYSADDSKNQHQGEFVKLENLDDLDGKPITTNIRSWAPHSVNTGENEYGYYVFKVHGDGPVSFEPQDDGWTDIYSIEVADDFENIDYIVSGVVPEGTVVTDTDLRLADAIDGAPSGSNAPTTFTHNYGEKSEHQFAYKILREGEMIDRPSQPNRSQFGLAMKYSLEGLDGSDELMPSLTANVSNANNGNGVKGRRNAGGSPVSTSITEDGLLTIAGQGQCVVVQKALTWDDQNNPNYYVVDIQRTVITITQDVDITWDYPYTWDFTNISSDTKTVIGGTNGTGNANWQKQADGSFKATDSFKNTFVQGGMLSSTGTYENLSTDATAQSGTGNRISEYEGLGFQTETNAASSATGLDVIGITVPTDKPGEHGGAGGMVIGNKETTVVVPDVPAGMTVYVRVEPQENASVNVNGVTTPDFTNATDPITQNDDEQVYSSTTTEAGDDELTLKNVVGKGIAVSDLKKTCYFRNGNTHEYFNTDSHALPIDYTLTLYYTNKEILAYQLREIVGKSAALGLVEKGPANTGYVVSTVYSDDNTIQRTLFVPCANDIKGDHMTKINTYSQNHLLPHVDAGEIEDEVGSGRRDNDHYDYYVLTNVYYKVDQEHDVTTGNAQTASVPGFYRVVSNDHSSLNRYRAYLKLEKTTGTNVKSIPLFDFDGELVDAIDEVPAVATNGIDVNGTFYTLQGMKIQGMPKQGGIYIQNGKKVMVK